MGSGKMLWQSTQNRTGVQKAAPRYYHGTVAHTSATGAAATSTDDAAEASYCKGPVLSSVSDNEQAHCHTSHSQLKQVSHSSIGSEAKCPPGALYSRSFTSRVYAWEGVPHCP